MVWRQQPTQSSGWLPAITERVSETGNGPPPKMSVV
jgi:hypothetical protein